MMTNKVKLLYVVIVTLLLINTGTLAFIFIYGAPARQSGPREVSRWITEQLQLNEEQQEQYGQLQDEHRKNMDAIHEQDRNLHDRYFKLLQDPAADSALVSQLADSIALNRKQTELTTFYDFQKIRGICSPEQQKKFDQIIGEALRMMAPRPRP
ncbi:MAG: periplasmic heavy metal sensor [Chitinophagales bacterium]|nr:periplasmic heavy metal sensor [Chitinophagales bacterium]